MIDDPAVGDIPRRLFHYNVGFLREKRLRRILQLAGHRLSLGLPDKDDAVIVWGKSPHAWRGEAVAQRRLVPLVRAEDAFLRSIRPGRLGDPPIGIMLGEGVHFDASQPSTLEKLVTAPADAALLARARDGIDRVRRLELSKYNAFDPDTPVPPAGYVLVVDQVRGDASAPSPEAFDRMLQAARDENPGARIVIKGHPETMLGLRSGHFAATFDAPASPWRLLAGADAVYTVSSQLGFEAILAGHSPRVFGHPFYAGWGLSQDENPFPRRGTATVEQLFAAAMIRAPLWYDPCRDRLCPFEDALDQMEAEVRAFREDRQGHVALGVRLWKRGRLQQVFGREKPLLFADSPARAQKMAAETGRHILVWAGKEPAGLSGPVRRVEDGFLRSRGLGAELVPPLSLVADDLGIYYDPTRESRLERLVHPADTARAERLVSRLVAAGLSKYNLSASTPDLPEGHRILVPGQVEDDASIRLGAGLVRTNAALLSAVRNAHPNAIIVYKPHPDVEAGLRVGAIDAGLADIVATQADPIALIQACDEVWTMTSLLGFEALLRGKPVTCLGTPFYAGWGLTTDLGPAAARRSPQPLMALAHAALIAYPRYYDPVCHRPCPPEVVLDRLTYGPLPCAGYANRLLAKVQGRLAGFAHLWRQ